MESSGEKMRENFLDIWPVVQRRANSKSTPNQCVLVEVLEGRTLSLSKWVVALPFPLPIKATKAKDTAYSDTSSLGYITHLHTQCLSFSYNHCS